MKYSSFTEIEGYVSARKGFQECIINSFWWAHEGLSFLVEMNYIWDASDEIRDNLDEPKLITLEFFLTQSLRFENALNRSILDKPENVNWGHREISILRVSHDHPQLSRFGVHGLDFYHADFAWESAQRLEIVFSELRVIDDPFFES